MSERFPPIGTDLAPSHITIAPFGLGLGHLVTFVAARVARGRRVSPRLYPPRMPTTRHAPRALAAQLRQLPLATVAEAIADLDADFAGLVLGGLYYETHGGACLAPAQRDHDGLVRLLLQIRSGRYDYVLETSAGPVFAVTADARPAIERVAAARLAERGGAGHD